MPQPPASGDGINGQYRGDLNFTEEDLSYGWPAHITVVANLRQNGAYVSGDFDLLNVIDSGGFVKDTIETGDGRTALDAFRADFWPDDLGDHFTIDTNIVASDGSQFAGTFIFAEGTVGRGNATFTRVK